MILGISLNSRVIGMAVLDGYTLQDYKVRLFKERWSEEKCVRIVNCIISYIIDYRITSLAVMLPRVHYRTPETKALLGKIKSVCRKKNVSIYCYPANALHAFSGRQKAKKRVLMEELSHRYPELGF